MNRGKSPAPVHPAPIALLTDFGSLGAYVGQMKAVLLSRAPGHPIVDLSHDVAPGDVREGAFLLETSWRFFPPETVFIAVVDPGVGTDRAAIAIRAADRYFVGPDNGLLTGALPSDSIDRAVRLESERYRLPVLSETFHGRDLFAPAGAALATGTAIDELGASVDSLVRLDRHEPEITTDRISGQIIHIDRFGNLVTNIRRESFTEWASPSGIHPIQWRVGETDGFGICRTYADAPVGEAILLFGSMGRLEIAVHRGSAENDLSAGRGTTVILQKR